MRVVVATRNRHKIAEIARILGGTGVGWDLISVDEGAWDVPEVVEDGATFADNAILKARSVSAATRMVAVADDSGLCVDALGGMPGVFSARWSGSRGDDVANLRLVLDQVSDIPDARRGAHFVCAAVAAFPNGRTVAASGIIDGSLAREPRGDRGFGYDPIFVPSGFTRTTAQMHPEEKDSVSHRGAAFRHLARLVAVSP